MRFIVKIFMIFFLLHSSGCSWISFINSKKSASNSPDTPATPLGPSLKLLTDFGAAPEGILSPVRIGDKLIYAGATAELGRELWAYDLSSKSAQLLKDINSGILSSSPSTFVESLGLVYFLASDPDFGKQLWVTDGTPSGTVQLTQLVSTAFENVGALYPYTGGILFSPNDVTTGYEPWKSNGTIIGTSLIKDINPGSGGSVAGSSFVQTDSGIIFFSANDGVNGFELWKTDGTEINTVMVDNTEPGAGVGTSPAGFVKFGNNVLYTATFTGQGRELWMSNGTTVTFLKDTRPGISNGNINPIIVHNGKGYFTGRDNPSDYHLWQTDGTPAGTYKLSTTAVSFFSSSFAFAGNYIFYSGIQGASTGIFAIDISGPGPYVENFVATASLQDMHSTPAAVMGGYYYVISNTAGEGRELRRINLSNLAFSTVKDIVPGATSGINITMSPKVLGNNVVFIGNDGASGDELWISDGTGPGTVLLKDISPGVGSTTFATTMVQTVSATDTLIFLAQPSAGNSRIWSSDGTTASTLEFSNAPRMDNPNDSFATIKTIYADVAGQLIFGGSFEFRQSLNSIDIISETPLALTSTAASLGSGMSIYHIYRKFEFGDVFLFNQNSTSANEVLSVTNGQPAGTQVLIDTNLNSNQPGNILFLGATSSHVYFAGTETTQGTELWRTDGTVGGTTFIKDINPGATSTGFCPGLVDFGTTFLFCANTAATGLEIWQSDGTTGGTALFMNINPAGASGLSFTYGLNGKKLGSDYLFAADNGTDGLELWKTDGTVINTTLLKNIHTTASVGSNPNSFHALDNTVVFTATDALNGTELWVTDGTNPGTFILQDITLGAGSSTFFGFVVFGSPKKLFFMVNNAVNGIEPWVTDGTIAGTKMIKDIFPGATSSISGVTASATDGNHVYFIANDGTHGLEIWKTDGTESGTSLHVESVAGAGAHTFFQLYYAGDKLFAVAQSPVLVREVYVYKTAP